MDILHSRCPNTEIEEGLSTVM